MTIRKLKALLWVLCVLALLGAGYTFYGIWEGKQQDRYTARDKEYFAELIGSRTDEVEQTSATNGYPPERYASLWTANIIGKEAPKPEAADRAAAAAERKPVVLPIDQVLTVGTIVYSDDPLRRVVKLTYLDSAGPASGSTLKPRHLWVGEGQALKAPYDEAPYHGKLLGIDKQSVTFQWAEEERQLTPKLGPDGAQQPIELWDWETVEDPLAALEEIPAVTTEIEPGKWIFGTQDRETLAADPQKLLREDVTIRTVPPSDSSPRSSIELREVKEGSLPSRIGFQSGDRIVSVNGVPMASEASAVNWYKQNDDLSSYHIVYLRRGAERSMTVFNRK